MTIDLDVLERVWRDATSGVWRRDENSVWGACDPDDTTSYGMGLAVLDCRSSKPSWSTVPMDYEQSVANAELVVAAVNALPDLIAAARERDALRAALKPFAKFGDVLPWMGGNYPISGPCYSIAAGEAGEAEITVEDFDRARQALNTGDQS